MFTLSQLTEPNYRVNLVLHFDIYYPVIFRAYFLRYGIDMFNLTNTEMMINIYNFYMHNLPALYEVHEMLEDDESKSVFRAFIKGKITNRVKDFKFAPETQYFLEGFFPEEGDIAIDGGAYDGATAMDFLMQGAKVYSFEMDAKNYQKCLNKAEKYNFVVENLGLSDKVSEGFYTDGNTGSSHVQIDTGLVAKFIDLDTYVIEKNLPRVDYIKLDIEGSELDMLHGARKSISRWKPKMAVSAYHKPEDLWTLAKYIKSIRSDYKFRFRHYGSFCTYRCTEEQLKILGSFNLNYFLPTHWEAVLYCK